MNRLQLWSQPQDPPPPRQVEIEQAILTTAEHRGVPHAIFAPMHYEQNYAYPLVVWLHGPRDDESQLRRIMPEVSMRNYVAVGPRGTTTDRTGFSWSDDDVESAERSVFECVDQARERFNIARQRIFLAGFDCGGSMAFRVGLRNPRSFGGVLSIGGPFPLGQMPLARLQQARDLPLFIAQGRCSEAYPIDRTCEELRLFHSAGMSVTLRQYPCGDELNTQMLRDMDVWMMELVTGISTSAEDDNPRYCDHDQLN